MSHKTLIICDRCGHKGESANGKPYPEGWCGLGVKFYTYNEITPANGDRRDVDLCPSCTDHLKAVLRHG